MKTVIHWLPFTLVAICLVYLNSFDPASDRNYVYSHNVGWPVTYAIYNSDTIPASVLNADWRKAYFHYLKKLILNFVACAIVLTSVAIFMRRLLNEWPQYSLRFVFIVMSMLIVVLVFNRFHEKLIGEIFTNAYGFPKYVGLRGTNLFVRLPILFGLYCVLYAAGWFIYRSYLFAVSKLDPVFNAGSGENTLTANEVTSREIEPHAHTLME